MKAPFVKSMIHDLVLAIGLPALSIVLLLSCAAQSAPPTAAAPPRGELEPAWISTEPVSAVILPDTTWFIEPYGVTITFKEGALKETAVFTFTPRPDLELDPPLVTTGYVFDFRGTLVSTGGPVSLWKAIRYTLQYKESELHDVSEHTLDVYRYSDWWMPHHLGDGLYGQIWCRGLWPADLYVSSCCIQLCDGPGHPSRLGVARVRHNYGQPTLSP
jgi:hypothetical protein